MDDGMAIDVVDTGHDALLELVLGGDADMAQDRAGELGEEALAPTALAPTLSRIPITGIAGCRACAASGHAAAPPSSVMNSRRLMPGMGAPSHGCRRRS